MNSFKNDISLLKLNESMEEFNEFITPVCLPLIGNVYDETDCWITGWGETQSKCSKDPPDPNIIKGTH